jgi:hypothetical protein
MQSNWREAAISGNVAILDRLLDEGIDINCRDRYGQTALMLASVQGRDDAVRFLLDRAADPDVTAKYSLSALMLAIINRHWEIARMLVEAGADTSITGTGAPGFTGKIAYDLAVEGYHFELAELIMRKKSSV